MLQLLEVEALRRVILFGQLLLEPRRGRQSCQDHEDDEKHEQDIGKRRDVDLSHHFLVLLGRCHSHRLLASCYFSYTHAASEWISSAEDATLAGFERPG